MAVLYDRDIDPVRNDRTDGLHEVCVDASQGSSGEQPKKYELQWKRPRRYTYVNPAPHERSQFRGEIGSNDDKVHFGASSADQLGAGTLHPTVTMYVVCDEGHNRDWSRRWSSHGLDTTSRSAARTMVDAWSRLIWRSAKARPRVPSSFASRGSARSLLIVSANASETGSTRIIARSRTRSFHVFGPSSATTGLPDASEAASVVLRDDGPSASAKSSTSQPARASERAWAGRTPVKFSAFSRPPCLARAQTLRPDGESAPGAPSSNSLASGVVRRSSKSPSSTVFRATASCP